MLRLPPDTFIAGSSGAVSFKAVVVEGKAVQALPSWVTIDPVTGTISGTPPKDAPAVLEIRITASDSKGNEAVVVVKIHNANADKGKQGRAEPIAPGKSLLAKLGLLGGKRAPLDAWGNLAPADDGDSAGSGSNGSNNFAAASDALPAWALLASDSGDEAGAPQLSLQLQRESQRFSQGGMDTLRHLFASQNQRQTAQPDAAEVD